jgi:ankyrin repeat protein
MMELFDSEEELSEHVAEMLAQNPDFLIEPHPELNGKTILYEAVKREKVSAVKVLLESGADPRQMNEKFGKFPIHVAAEKANKKILGLLLEHMNGPTEIDVNVQV